MTQSRSAGIERLMSSAAPPLGQQDRRWWTMAQPAVATNAAPRPVSATTTAPVSYKSCAAAKAAGVTPLHRGDPGYSTNLDRDGDGVACE